MVKYVVNEQRFLNKPGFHSTAAIIVRVTDTGETWGPSYLLTLSDCSRTIHLELSSGNLEHTENSIHKLTQIIEVCQEMRKALRAEKRAKRWEKRKEEVY